MYTRHPLELELVRSPLSMLLPRGLITGPASALLLLRLLLVVHGATPSEDGDATAHLMTWVRRNGGRVDGISIRHTVTEPSSSTSASAHPFPPTASAFATRIERSVVVRRPGGVRRGDVIAEVPVRLMLTAAKAATVLGASLAATIRDVERRREC